MCSSLTWAEHEAVAAGMVRQSHIVTTHMSLFENGEDCPSPNLNAFGLYDSSWIAPTALEGPDRSIYDLRPVYTVYVNGASDPETDPPPRRRMVEKEPPD